MLTMSLRVWSFCAVVTMGFAAVGCAAETSGPVATGSDDVSSTGEVNDTLRGEIAEDAVVAHRKDDVEMLADGPGPGPGDPTSRVLPYETAPRLPNPCPGQLTPVPQAW